MALSNPLESPHDLVSLLHSGTLRCKTGLWLLPPECVGREADEAARLGVELVDLSVLLLASLPPDARFADLTERRVEEIIYSIANDPRGTMSCVLMVGLDLLLSGFTTQGRSNIWNYLFDLPHAERSVLAAIPASATQLLPASQDLERWKLSGRLCGSTC